MATAVVARPAARPQARSRDEEVLVWPDLVFIEFISAMVFTISLFFLSFAMNAPLQDQANADVTPNPSKAPWYLLNLQELLLHMNAALAGVIVPTVWLGLMAAFPYFDREQRDQGVWFGSENCVKLTIVAGLVGIIGTWILIFWDAGTIAAGLGATGLSGGDTFRFLENVRSIETQLPWPEWTREVPFSPVNIVIIGEEFQYLDFPAWLVEQAIPIGAMVGLPTIMVYVLWRMGWVINRHSALIALFSGFIGAYAVLTAVGTGFRGQGQDLVFPWQLKLGEGIPGQEAHGPDAGEGSGGP
jgi:menaquinol-cytochrome c reductase cytochrome b/c subunit